MQEKNYNRYIMPQSGARLYCGSSRKLHPILSLVRRERLLERKVRIGRKEKKRLSFGKMKHMV